MLQLACVHLCRSTNVIMKPVLGLVAIDLAAAPRKMLLHVIDRGVVENSESSGQWSAEDKCSEVFFFFLSTTLCVCRHVFVCVCVCVNNTGRRKHLVLIGYS